MWLYRLPRRVEPKCSPLPGVAKHDIVRQLGAVPLDYPSTSIEEIVQTFTDGHGFDVVYDTVGGSTLDNAFQGC
jgi:NADPH:quinone reductase-like Zn-dependent oxidoreductase